MKKHIFWTGGFDSTFRLLQLIDDSCVSKIHIWYLALKIDNKSTSQVARMNRDHEITTMHKILSQIDRSKIVKFNIIGESEKLLYYHLIFGYQFMNFISKEQIHFSDRTKALFFDLWANNIVSRPISQWTAITQILDDFDIEAEICLERGGGIWSRIKDWVVDGEIQFHQCPGLEALRRYQIPLFDLDKEDMLKIANQSQIEILRQTWSCWYPQDDSPCQLCFACLARPKF